MVNTSTVTSTPASPWSSSLTSNAPIQGNGAGVKDLPQVVAGVGADLSAFRECLAAGKMDEKVQENIQQAKSLGVNGTPATFVVDNKTGKSQLLGGAQPPEAIMAAMRKMVVEDQEQSAAKQ